jgi:hypothetical protein
MKFYANTKVWAKYGQSMGKIWAKYGQSMGKVWAKYGQNMGKVWATSMGNKYGQQVWATKVGNSENINKMKCLLKQNEGNCNGV